MIGTIFGFMAGGKMKLILGAGLAIVLFFAWMHYKNIRDHRLQLIAENAVLTVVIETQKATFIAYQEGVVRTAKKTQAALSKIETQRNKALRTVNDLEKKLGRHDVSFLAKRRPESITGVFNRGTNKLFKSLEETSRCFSERNCSAKPAGVQPASPVKSPAD